MKRARLPRILLRNAQRLRLRPGDTVVVTVEQHLRNEMVEALRAQLSREFPGRRVIVLSGGMKIGAVSA